MPKTYRIQKEEYDFLQIAKRTQALRDEEQLNYNRKQSIRVNKLRISQKEREQEFRWNQIQSGIPLEKSEITLDGKKPIFVVHNDYDQCALELEGLKESVKLLEEEMAKNEAKDVSQD